jgi:methionine aminopeptidase
MKKLLSLYFIFGSMITIQAQETMITEKNNNGITPTEDSMDDHTKSKLILADQKTRELFKMVEDRGLIAPGKSERELSDAVVKLAKEEFGMVEHWHKKIVRAGINTLEPYSKNPPDRIIQKDDIVILDFGPNYEGWETDLGRTYVIGNDPAKLKLKRDVEAAWNEAKEWFDQQPELTGAEYWNYIIALAKQYGYEFGGEIGGHIIGQYPHEQPDKGAANQLSLDIHPDNHDSILLLDKQGNRRQWLLEIHFVDRTKGIGAFYEQLLN